MIKLPDAIYVATQPVNLHLSFDRLAGLVREQLGGNPRGEAVFVFHNRRRTHIKILWHDGRGYWIFYKRLDRGTFRVPLAIPPGADSVSISRRELGVLLRGIDHRLISAARRRSLPKP
jgi:transposase